ncbi:MULTISPECIES: hypothetical protein [Acetobacter]|uniref:Phage gp6-like head-tail connector protein n=2 Tax=Acetobacter TaxID=434 RepID=A0A5B9GHZ5_9PROT|nr:MULTISPECIES: hypothetical protein [Acetobacter]MCP1202195.1 hypothetical protein [Acetobacter oryzoeni]QEE85901.1 hypothetical protein EOV40_009375 [Acetobacter oryzoeni]GCD59274.1 hypothetical protein NBRC3277_1849 [Acetobacter pasteurianus NBRC 3277]GCD62770.1 hypothetical protein NBRC3278_1863 [Acetobacter pasteurianus NBRC 3278]GCD69139.1 hypothetical protein NBRC3280_1774 [Acetobacter pasteurianus NBRC 3280]
MTTDLTSTFIADLTAQSETVDANRVAMALNQAWGIASDYCGQDVTTLDPMPQTITRTVMDIAAAIYHQAARDRSITQDQTEGVGATSFGLSGWADMLENLDPWRGFHVA